MIKVISLPNKKKVMAPLIHGWHYLETDPEEIEIIGPVTTYDPVDPCNYSRVVHFQDDLLGVKVRAIFNHQSLGLLVDQGCVGIYLGDLIEAVNFNGNLKTVERLRDISSDDLSLLIIRGESYRIL